ncbi:MAG TPA: hypothetical protein VG347_20315 [Verrucomicrobiae bacterium]|nr:hypothetical protein [Verrucomicrobiae bacterium]
MNKIITTSGKKIAKAARASMRGAGLAAAIANAPLTFGNIQLPQFANEIDRQHPILGADRGTGYKPGQVFFANETSFHPDSYDERLSSYMNLNPRLAAIFANDSQFLETYYSQPLTNFTTGWRDPNDIEATLQFFAPAVPVGRRFEWKAAANAEEFLSELVDDQRAIGADFKAVKYTGTDVTDKTINRGLTIIVDLDNVADTGVGAGQVPGWQQNAVAKLTRRLYRNSFRRALAAIAASAVNTNLVWNAQPVNPAVIPVNPDMDVVADLVAQTNITGIRNNRVAYGDTAALYRQQAYGAQNNPAGYMGYAGTAQEAALASAIGVDKVYISRERYQTGANAKSEILGAKVYSFYAQDGVDTEDPSNIKRFVSTFDGEQGGGLFRVYVQQISSKLVAVTVEFYEKIVITYAGGIRSLTIANQ